jgi:hypothetical protein
MTSDDGSRDGSSWRTVLECRICAGMAEDERHPVPGVAEVIRKRGRRRLAVINTVPQC